MQIEWKQLLFTYSGCRIPLPDGLKQTATARAWRNWKNMDLVKIHATERAVRWYKSAQLCRLATVTIYSTPTRELHSFLWERGSYEDANVLKTKAYGQICVSASYAKTNREPGVFRNSLTEQRHHSQQDFAADFCELEIVFWKQP